MRHANRRASRHIGTCLLVGAAWSVLSCYPEGPTEPVLREPLSVGQTFNVDLAPGDAEAHALPLTGQWVRIVAKLSAEGVGTALGRVRLLAGDTVVISKVMTVYAGGVGRFEVLEISADERRSLRVEVANSADSDLGVHATLFTASRPTEGLSRTQALEWIVYGSEMVPFAEESGDTVQVVVENLGAAPIDVRCCGLPSFQVPPGGVGVSGVVARVVPVKTLTLSSSTGADPVPARVSLRAVDFWPEHAPRGFVPGDTIDEVIDHEGDVDEFVLTARGGERIMLYGRVVPGVGDSIHVSMSPNPYGSTDVPIVFGRGEALWSHRTSSAVPSKGDYQLSVRGSTGARYQLRFVALTDGPEWTDRSVNLGDQMLEVTDTLGDVDEFRFYRREPVEAFRQTAWHYETGVVEDLWIVDLSGRQYLFINGTLPASLYRLRLLGTVEGPHLVSLRALNPAPEQALPALTLGTPSAEEPLAPWNDEDQFTFAGQAGDTMEIRIQRLDDRSGRLLVRLRNPEGISEWSGLFADQPSTSLVDAPFALFPLSKDGVHTVVVTGRDLLGWGGSFRLLVSKKRR